MRKSANVTIHADKIRFPVSPTLYGLFFEEISHAGDGGIYAELIRNRSFEDTLVPDRCHVENCKLHSPAGWISPFEHTDPIPGWYTQIPEGCEAEIKLDDALPLNETNPISLKVEAASVPHGRVSVCNTGFWGIPVRSGETYNLSFYGKKADGFQGDLEITLEDRSGNIYASGSVTLISGEWLKYELTLESDRDDAEAILAFSTRSAGTFWLELVSLFPATTFLHRKNGLRPDLVGMLQQLKPSFLRFPGGCFVEGFSVETAYRWKKTIGDISERTSHWTLWQYRTTNGLGYHEYLQMAEDMGLDMMFVVNCGLTCQGRPGEMIPMEDLSEWVQDMLDAIEYANGPVAGYWGSLRAKNGHPEPFGLKYLEIGNENFGPEYNLRYRVFYEAVKEKYPEIVTIWNTHWEVGTETKGLPVEIVDEHFYADNDFYQQYHDMYDHYDRSGPKIYVGEYAMIVDNKSGTLLGALSEAAFMTGMERNQDLVTMSSYAPLFANIHHTVWDPSLIYFDGTRVYGTPSFHIQKMFGEHRGEYVVDSYVATESRPAVLYGGLGVEEKALDRIQDLVVSNVSETLLRLNRLSGSQPQCREFHGTLLIGDPSWSQYDVSAKAILGSEGIRLRLLDRHLPWDKQNYLLWELDPDGESRLVRIVGWSRVKLAPDQKIAVQEADWQHMQVTIVNDTVKCFLNGELLHEYQSAPIPYLTSVSTLDRTAGELIIKLVNPSPYLLETEIHIHGAGNVPVQGIQTVLTSGNPKDANTIDRPESVSPKESDFRCDDGVYPLPPYAAAILRIKI